LSLGGVAPYGDKELGIVYIKRRGKRIYRKDLGGLTGKRENEKGPVEHSTRYDTKISILYCAGSQAEQENPATEGIPGRRQFKTNSS